MRYFDDIAVGDRMELGTHVFSADDIKRFAAQYDPQAFHMDEAAAAASHFGALCASGWHTVAVWMNCAFSAASAKTPSARRAARSSRRAGRRPAFAICDGCGRSTWVTRSPTHPRSSKRVSRKPGPAGDWFSRATPASTRTARWCCRSSARGLSNGAPAQRKALPPGWFPKFEIAPVVVGGTML